MALFLAAVLVTAPVHRAQACTAIIAGYGAASIAGIGAEIAALTLAITDGFTELKDVLVRLANQITNNNQNFTDATAIENDKHTTNVAASAIGQVRTEAAVQMVPSRVACRVVTRQRFLNQTTPEYLAVRNAMVQPATDYAMSAPGQPSEKGALAALNAAWNNRCTNYADVANMSIPSGVTCPGPGNPDYINLDITPQKTLFGPIMYQDPQYQTAAIDTIRLLTQVAPDDPIRGPALSRAEGQNIHVLRMRDLTRMNLVRSILEDSVALRAVPTTAGPDGRKISRLGRYIELMTGQKAEEYVSGTTTTAQLDAVLAAAEPENANVQSVATRLAAQKMMLIEFLRMTEQMVAVEAVNLAVQVEGSRAGDVGIAARVIQAN
jgi:hypothetical protein